MTRIIFTLHALALCIYGFSQDSTLTIPQIQERLDKLNRDYDDFDGTTYYAAPSVTGYTNHLSGYLEVRGDSVALVITMQFPFHIDAVPFEEVLFKCDGVIDTLRFNREEHLYKIVDGDGDNIYSILDVPIPTYQVETFRRFAYDEGARYRIEHKRFHQTFPARGNERLYIRYLVEAYDAIIALQKITAGNGE